MITFTSSVRVKSFESMIPDLTKQFQRACRHMNPADREEAVQDMLAMAFVNYKSLVDRKLYDNIFFSAIGNYAIRGFRSGRRFCGMSSTDVMAARCQIVKRSDVRGYTYYDASSHQWIEVLVYDRVHDPALIGEFNLDFPAWRESLNEKPRDILDAILREETTNEIARNFNLTPGRISQIRRALVESYQAFVGNVETSVS